MARRLTPEEIEGLLGAYALGAVDADERAAIEAYVVDHPAAAEELEQLQDAAVWLAVSGAPASRDLWDRIAAATEPEPPPLRVPERGRASTSSWFTPRRVLALAAALVAVLAIGVGVVVSRDDSSRPDLAAAIQDAQASPSARRIVLASASGDAQVDAVMLPDGTGYVVRSDLPRLASDRTYQLWGIDGSNVVSLGVLGRELRPSAFTFAGSPDALAITEEVAGGVPQPRNEPVVSGRVPA
jgi:anti-sigma-K factor RskA